MAKSADTETILPLGVYVPITTAPKENFPENYVFEENNKDSKKKKYLFCKEKIWHSRSERYDDHKFDCKHSFYDKIQICIMMDLTGSMDKYLEESKNTIKTFLNKTKSELNIQTELFQIAFIGFKDHCRCGEIDHRKDDLIKAIDFTNETQILEFIEKLNVDGGGDWCEAVVDGLDAVNNLSWDLNDHTIKFTFLVMDAPPHGKEFYDNNLDEEKKTEKKELSGAEEILEKEKRKCSLSEYGKEKEAEILAIMDHKKVDEKEEKPSKKKSKLSSTDSDTDEDRKKLRKRSKSSSDDDEEKKSEGFIEKKTLKTESDSSDDDKTGSFSKKFGEKKKIEKEIKKIEKKKKIIKKKLEDGDFLLKILLLSMISDGSASKDAFPGGCPCKKNYSEIILQLTDKKIIFFLEKLTSHLEIMKTVFKKCGMNLYDAQVDSPQQMTELVSNQLVSFLKNEEIVVFQ